MEKMNMKIFWIRFVVYILLGLIAPTGFLIYKFNLFAPTTKLNIGGWGIVVIVFTAIFMAFLTKQLSDLIESELGKKIVNSIRKVLIPLLTATLCIFAVGEFWNDLLQFFIVLTLCEPIAYVANPMPELIKQKQEEKDMKKEESKLLNIFNLFWSSKK